MSVGRFLQQAAAGSAGGATYVDDVFSTYLYEGNGSTQTITNGIDLAGEGGMVWLKVRDDAYNHQVFDTERGPQKRIFTDTTNAESTSSTSLTSFNSDGFTNGTNSLGNQSGKDYASWTFRKQPGFFDIVTYTGNSTNGHVINHNLGSTPGCIIIKNLTTSGYAWTIYHRSIPTQYIEFNTNAAQNTALIQQVNSTSFVVQNNAAINGNNQSYVAYIFAHDAQDFGTNSDEAIIKCGSYTGNGNTTTGQDIDVGFEPQFIMVKGSSVTSDWSIYDSMRGFVTNGTAADDSRLMANRTNAESLFRYGHFTSNGFNVNGTSNVNNGSGQTYIYVAIRRPHKPASEFAATDLFDVDGYTGTAGTLDPAIQFPFDTDMFMLKRTNATGDMNVFSRLVEYPTTGGNVALSGLVTSSTAAESDTYTFRSSDARDIAIAQDGADNLNVSGGTYIYYGFRRAPGFFDVVAYTGQSAEMEISHNLGVTPELIIQKCRTQGSGYNWNSWYTGLTNSQYINLNGTAAVASSSNLWGTNSTVATDSIFRVGAATTGVNGGSSNTHIAYLFATVPGISKVGSYSGTGATQTIDCGFSSGARFVLIKSTTYSSGSWFVFDTERGITTTAPTSPFLTLNSTSAESSSSVIEPDPTGFKIIATGNGTNGSGQDYIFLAIA